MLKKECENNPGIAVYMFVSLVDVEHSSDGRRGPQTSPDAGDDHVWVLPGNGLFLHGSLR